MNILLFAFLIGVLNGLRSFTPPAATAWAARLGWLKLQGALALIGSAPSVAIFTLLAVGELVADKLPIPNRTAPPGLIARIVMGGLTGACVAAAGGQSALTGSVLGAIGGVIGCFGGYHARARIVKAPGKPDLYVALAEDAICVAGSLWVLSRIQY